jgi:hypothetical protein
VGNAGFSGTLSDPHVAATVCTTQDASGSADVPPDAGALPPPHAARPNAMSNAALDAAGMRRDAALPIVLGSFPRVAMTASLMNATSPSR